MPHGTTRTRLILTLGATLVGAPLSGCNDPSKATARMCTIANPAPSDSRLHADGTWLKDALGRTVFLRGVNAGGRSKLPPYSPFDYPDGGFAASLDAYMSHAASWGIDVMRVPFTWAALEPVQGRDDSEWLGRYDQLIDSAWAHGIWTIIDFHQDVFAEPLCGDGFPAWTVPDAGPRPTNCSAWQLEYFNDQQVKDAFDGFWANTGGVQSAYFAAWDRMIARYKDRPGVIGFEPFNEPAAGGADESTFEATTLTDFYSVVVPRINAGAPSSLVFVDAPGVNGASLSTKLQRPKGVGIVFAPHYYPIVPDDSDESAEANLAAWVKVGAAWNAPVLVGEFAGANTDPENAPSVAFVFAALDALNLHGTQWEYSASAQEWNGETDSIVSADGGEYAVAVPVQRPFARAVAGSSAVHSFDSATGEFYLSYVPELGGVTEIDLPARLYRSGIRIALSGACADPSTIPGRLLLQPDSSGATVVLSLLPK